MKILWIVNIMLPEVAAKLSDPVVPLGGWLVNASKILSEINNLELVIVFPHNKLEEGTRISGEKITYYSFKTILDKNKQKIDQNEVFLEILKDEKPNLVHIHGTELAHSIAMSNACKRQQIRTVVSIQGMVSIIAQHLYSNLPLHAIYGHTFRTLLLRDNISGLKKIYQKRAVNEKKTILNTQHIIGRTTWDKACSTQINKDAKYHFCYETLREPFYEKKWDFNQIDKHTIFISQAQYPVKGFHTLLEAMPIILKRFPDAKVKVSGKNFINVSPVLQTYYSLYIKKIINKYQLSNKVDFLGMLNENQMCDEFLKCHVFVSASTIENESNSLSEARMLGVPSVASFVGGVTDRVRQSYDGFLYQHDAPYMLAYYVCEIFSNNDLAKNFSELSREQALLIHDRSRNIKTLQKIYTSIMEENEK